MSTPYDAEWLEWDDDSRDQQASALVRVTVVVCGDCLSGQGGECHTPGCALWMKSAPDIPFVDYCEAFEVVTL